MLVLVVRLLPLLRPQCLLPQRRVLKLLGQLAQRHLHQKITSVGSLHSTMLQPRDRQQQC
jgi:hypothetical protein